MKIFKFLAVALVAMLGFTACDKDCDHNFIEHDYNEALIGTWTCLEEGQAEAMVINPDGSFEVTGFMKGGSGSLYESKGTIKVVNNKVSLVFEGDKDVIEGRLELVAGKSLSIVLNEENDIRLTYNYCENDLSDEVIGMWVSFGNSSNEENNMFIQTFNENGKSTYTGFGEMDGEIVVIPTRQTRQGQRQRKTLSDSLYLTAERLHHLGCNRTRLCVQMQNHCSQWNSCNHIRRLHWFQKHIQGEDTDIRHRDSR